MGILDDYANLLILQYRNKDKMLATVKLLVNQSVCDELPLGLPSAFNLETAIGEQLTILGKIVGVSRQIYGADLSKSYFNFTMYNTEPPSIGFRRYSDPVYQYYIRRYLVGNIYTLSDFDMRVLIKLKIIFNNTYMTFKALKERLYDFFSGDIDILAPEVANQTSDLTFFNFTRYDDDTPPDSTGFGRYLDSPYEFNFYRFFNYDVMTLTYQVIEDYHIAFEAARFLDVVPRPMGVELSVNYV